MAHGSGQGRGQSLFDEITTRPPRDRSRVIEN